MSSQQAGTGSDTWRQVFFVLSVLASIGVGTTADYGSATRTQSLVIPVDSAFAIWGPIYLGALALAVYQALPSRRADPLLRRVSWPAALAYLSVGCWVRVFPWGWYLLSQALVFFTLATVALAYARLGPSTAATPRAERWLVRVPLGLLFGWITLATVAASTELLLAEGVGDLVLGATPWAVILLLVAGAVATAVTLRARGSLAYPGALVWGLAGVTLQQLPRSSLIGLLAAGMALALAAAAAWTVVRPSSKQHSPA